MMKTILVVGAGGLGRETVQWIKDINRVSPEWIIKGFLDDNPDALQRKACDVPIVGTIRGYQPLPGEYFVIAIAATAAKKSIVTALKSRGARFASLVHPIVRIGEFNEIGEGVVFTPGSGMSVNVKIGAFASIQGIVGHDTVVGDFSTICPGALVAGAVRLGEGVFVGCGATITPGCVVGAGATIGVGSTVMTKVKPGTTVVGNPATRFEWRQAVGENV